MINHTISLTMQYTVTMSIYDTSSY